MGPQPFLFSTFVVCKYSLKNSSIVLRMVDCAEGIEDIILFRQQKCNFEIFLISWLQLHFGNRSLDICLNLSIANNFWSLFSLFIFCFCLFEIEKFALFDPSFKKIYIFIFRLIFHSKKIIKYVFILVSNSLG